MDDLPGHDLCGIDQVRPHRFDTVNSVIELVSNEKPRDGGGYLTRLTDLTSNRRGCTRLGLRLATAVREEFCLWCLQRTGEKYRWLAYGGDGEPSHRICGDCRDQIIFTERDFTRGPRGGLP